MHRLSGLAAAGVTLILVASGCGSSGGNAAKSTAITTAPTKLTGAPIKIGLISSDVSNQIAVPDVHRAANIAVQAVNDEGGVKGRPLELHYCDDHDDAQEAGLCAQKLLVSEDVVSLVGAGPASGGAPLYPVLASTNKINFGNFPITINDFTDPRSYPFVQASATGPLLGGVMPKGNGEKVDVVTYTGYEAIVKALVGPGLAAKNYELHLVTGAPTTVDWSVPSSQVAQDHPKYVIPFMAQDKAPLLVKALGQASVSADVVIPASTVSAEGAKVLATLSAPTIVAVDFATDTSAFPMRKKYESDLKQYGARFGIKDTIGTQVINSWLAIKLFARVAAELPTIDGPSLKAYMDGQTAFDTGLTHALDFTKPGAIRGFARVFNSWILPGKIEKGRIVTTSNEWVGV